MISKREIRYENFGRCLEISNGIVSAVVTLDVGPRVIRYSFVDGENVMFEDRDRVFFRKGEVFDTAYGAGSVWYTYGGHRLWTSPEEYPRSYYPDNSPVPFSLTERGAIFSPETQKWNGCRHEIEIDMSENSSDTRVRMRVINRSPWSVTLAPWGISALAAGGTVIVPQPQKDTFMAPNRHVALWSYDRMTDRRFTMLDKYVILRHDKQADDIPFKFGINSEHGYAMFFVHGDMFLKRFEAKENGNYPDGGMSFESYTNNLFIEMESLGELVTLDCGETAEHTETWSLLRAPMPELNDIAIDEFIKKNI